VKKCETLTLYTRALITPGRTRKILIGEGVLLQLDIINVVRTVLTINDLQNRFPEFCQKLFFFRKLTGKQGGLRQSLIDQSLVMMSPLLQVVCIYLFLFSRSTFDHKRSHLPLETLTNDHK
jgi:hypothetical protein